MSVGTGAGKVKETELQKTRTDIGIKYYEDYRKRWRPARDRLISRVKNDEASNKDRAQAMAGGAVDAAFSGQATGISNALAKRGAGVGSAKNNLAMAESFANQAQSRGLAKVDAAQASEDIEFGKKQGLTAIGRGEVASANAGMSAQATLSGAQAQADAQRSLQKAVGTGELIGTALGAGASMAFGGGKAKPTSIGGDAMADWGTAAGGSMAGSDDWSR